jgi:hypothetical protein
MNEWLEAEARRLQAAIPALECPDGGMWWRLAEYALPPGWSLARIELVFQMPQGIPGQDPYGFWTRPTITLADGRAPTNSSGPVEVPGLGGGWLQFSWAPENWRWGPRPGEGLGMVDFVRSIERRLSELN